MSTESRRMRDLEEGVGSGRRETEPSLRLSISLSLPPSVRFSSFLDLAEILSITLPRSTVHPIKYLRKNSKISRESRGQAQVESCPLRLFAAPSLSLLFASLFRLSLLTPNHHQQRTNSPSLFFFGSFFLPAPTGSKNPDQQQQQQDPRAMSITIPETFRFTFTSGLSTGTFPPVIEACSMMNFSFTTIANIEESP